MPPIPMATFCWMVAPSLPGLSTRIDTFMFDWPGSGAAGAGAGESVVGAGAGGGGD